MKFLLVTLKFSLSKLNLYQQKYLLYLVSVFYSVIFYFNILKFKSRMIPLHADTNLSVDKGSM